MLQEQTIALGLAMFGLLVQRCTELLRETPAGTHSHIHTGSQAHTHTCILTLSVPATCLPEAVMAEEGGEGEELEGMVRVSAFPSDLRDLLPSIKVWSDWMLGHPDLWNPPPCSIE